VGGQGVFDTLLGPERTHAASLFWGARVLSWLSRTILESYREPGRSAWLVLRVGGCLGWLFENCTVDASIFVVKLLRAHGGCLGIRSR
jgi:hypothetical protein